MSKAKIPAPAEINVCSVCLNYFSHFQDARSIHHALPSTCMKPAQSTAPFVAIGSTVLFKGLHRVTKRAFFLEFSHLGAAV
jgi:hypothetical protein